MTPRSATSKPLKTGQAKSHETVLSTILLGLCLGILALRCTVTESPASRLSTLATNLHDLAYSLTLSMLLLFAAGLWAIRVLHGKARTCKTTLEWGISLFVTGGLLSTCFASDKRAAVSDMLVQVAPMAMAWLLIQLLNTPAKIRLTLALIAVLGLLSAFESYSQFSTVNQETIEAYEQNPAQFLEPLGLTQGTFEHFLFEHRLYSQGVRSFFTTRNSNGSFLLMAVLAALALAVEGAVQYREKHNTLAYPVAALLVALINLNALLLTKSKGALGGLALACLGIALVFLVGPFLKRHARAVFLICILGVILATGSLIQYGRTHDTLPGGNSLLVRWQYWQATVHMIAQHPWLGVGPGNFAHRYYQYKAAASPESVADPHNIILSLMSQYGPLGLMGFILTVAWPLVTVIQWHKRAASPEMNITDALNKRLYWGMTFVVCTLLLLVKPMMGMIIQDTLPVILLTCLVHTLMLCMGMLVLLSTSTGKDTESSHCTLHWAVPVLVCCILGILAANMIDFALFEPGVLSSFWVMIACTVATYNVYGLADPQPWPAPSQNRKAVTGMIAATLLVGMAVGYIPVLISTFSIYRANQAWTLNRMDQAHQALDQGARLDWLSDTAYYQNGRMYLDEYEQSSGKSRGVLDKARTCFEKAIQRNPASYRNYERLTDVCVLIDPNTAIQAAQQAVQRYPGCARLRVKLATVYDRLGQTDQALEAYQAALDIEDQFQQQFKTMYPDNPVIHRLDREYLDKAMERVGQSQGQAPPQ
jgi:O-antigen ligase